MKYTILTLGNPERYPYVAHIRDQMSNYEEVFTTVVNGKDAEQLNSAIDHFGFRINFPEWRPGEGGVWYSNIYAWEKCVELDEDLMVFEDDAVLSDDFGEILEPLRVPEPFDFATFYLPYTHPLQAARFRLHPVRQEHGNVCVLYSPAGARKILDLLEQDGLMWPVDIWLYKQAIAGILTGYGPVDSSRRIVTVDYKVPTNIHDDERIATHQPERHT